MTTGEAFHRNLQPDNERMITDGDDKGEPDDDVREAFADAVPDPDPEP